jgi:hypothetical protein
MHRHDLIPSRALSDPPRPRPGTGLDVLAAQQPQQPDRIGLLSDQLDAVDGFDDLDGRVHQPGDQPLDIGGIIPIADRFPRRLR